MEGESSWKEIPTYSRATLGNNSYQDASWGLFKGGDPSPSSYPGELTPTYSTQHTVPSLRLCICSSPVWYALPLHLLGNSVSLQDSSKWSAPPENLCSPAPGRIGCSFVCAFHSFFCYDIYPSIYPSTHPSIHTPIHHPPIHHLY